MGIFGLVMITAPAIGPTLSGWVIEHYTWRTLFGIVLPFAILTLIYAFFKLRNITPNRDMKLDVFSLILSSVGFGGLLYGFSSAGDKGWDSPLVYGTIIIGTIALVTFIVRQLRMDDPMLDFKIYKHPMFALSSAISIVLSIAMFSGMILDAALCPNHTGDFTVPLRIAYVTGSNCYGAYVASYRSFI